MGTAHENPRQTLAEFIEQADITATAKQTDSNPNMDGMKDGRHWRVTLRREGRQLTIPFSQGSAHTEPPTAADVLGCLALDSAGFLNTKSFEDWCSEYGYDTDSRKAEKTFRVIEGQAARLSRFLGVGLYDSLLWNTEND